MRTEERTLDQAIIKATNPKRNIEYPKRDSQRKASIEAVEEMRRRFEEQGHVFENWDNEEEPLTWSPIGDDYMPCPKCNKKFDVFASFLASKRCPICGQKYDIQIFFD